MRQNIVWEEAKTGVEAREKAKTETEAPNSREPVVYFEEWTTSSPGKGRNRVKSPEKA